MKEYPILFSGEMVRAILEGRKTQTRRVINPQPIERPIWYNQWLRWNLVLCKDGLGRLALCPYGQPGDRLWVRETWAASMMVDDWKPSEIVPEDVSWWYKAGEPHHVWEGDVQGKWRPSIFMPRWASRITLEVTSVRVERVQEISPFDCQAEGIIGSTKATPIRRQPYEEYSCGDGLIYTSPRDAFRALWDEINGDRGFAWDSNPWVWVVEFRRAE